MKRISNIAAYFRLPATGYRSWLCLVSFFFLSQFAFAQVDSLNKAIDCYNKKDYKCARIAIDAATNDPGTSKLTNTWLIRAFIYKEYFKNYETTDPKSPARDEAVNAMLKVIEMDTTANKQFADANLKQSLKYLASTYYNSSTDFFNAEGYPRAIMYYEKYKKCNLAVDPNFDWRPTHIQFYLSLGTAMEAIYTSNRTAYLQFMEITGQQYRKVIEVDTNNVTAYYNLCMLYYNHGVSIINDMSDNVDIMDLDNIQQNALTFFKQALPFALKAYKLDPKRRETLVALSGIYFSMHEDEKSALIKAELDKLDGK